MEEKRPPSPTRYHIPEDSNLGGNAEYVIIQGDTKKREVLKCVVAAMYSWQYCGTGTLSYRQPRHSVIMDQWNGQQPAFAIKNVLQKQ